MPAKRMPGPKISDAAVHAKTGKTWPEWFAVLDRAHAAAMNHKEIVAYLAAHHHPAPWWQQMITVTYEQVRGHRARHEKPEGFEISVGKTVPVPVGKLFRTWTDAKWRQRWLPKPDIVIRKKTPARSIRALWIEGESRLSVDFMAKSAGKSQVSVQHSRLRSAREAARMKAFWRDALDKLSTILTRS